MSTIGWCPLGRLGELQAFIDEHWKRGHVLSRDAELLRWQHPRDDPDELSVLVAADDDGRMQGILGIIPVPYCRHGARGDGAWLTTWVVTEAARRSQLGLALLRHAMDGPDFVGTIGGNETTMRLLRALRFATRPAVPRWVRIGEPAALAALLGEAGKRLPASAPATGPPRGVDVQPWSPELAAAWDRTWRERLAPGLVGTWHDSEYLRWRYLDHPRFRYALRVAVDAGGSVSALLVWRRQTIQDRDQDVVRILELLGDPVAANALAADLVHETVSERTAFLDFYCTSAEFAAPLAAAGFVPEDQLGARLPAVFQPLDPRRTALTAAFWAPDGHAFEGAATYFTRSDCDQDRPN